MRVFIPACVLVILTLLGVDLTVSISGQNSHVLQCPAHKTFDLVWPGYDRRTCKTVGAGIWPKCELIHFRLGQSILCPNHGYYTGWKVLGKSAVYRCCHQKGLTYSHKNCRTQYNYYMAKGKVYEVLRGYAIVGSTTHDNGLTWVNYVCDYDSKPRYYGLQSGKMQKHFH